MANIVYAYSDGSAIGNPGPAGFGVVLTYRDSRKEISRGFRLSTNNRMELLGAITALETLKRPSEVLLITDSKYVVDAIVKGWATAWKKNGWRKRSKGRVENTDLWDRILRQIEVHDVSFEWIKGHAGHAENERCDELANLAAHGMNLAADSGYEARSSVS